MMRLTGCGWHSSYNSVKRIGMDILITVAFPIARVTKDTEKDDSKLLRMLEYLSDASDEERG